MFKIKLADGEFYKNTSSRVQHFKTEEQGKAKIDKLAASGATLVECKARTATAKIDKIEEKASETKAVKAIKTKKASTKTEKHDKSASIKTRKA